MNYALHQKASQSNTYGDLTAENAVDGDLNTKSIATINNDGSFTLGDHWWKVDIGRRIVFTNATIYVRDGKCGQNDEVDCCKYY